MTAKKKTILIVDDVRLNRRTIANHLSPLDYGFTEAANGIEALEKAKEQPDLILMDVMMPGMDGIEACRKLKQDDTTKDIPVIFLSAVEDSQTKIKGLEEGGVDYVNKPVEPKELLARVKTHLTLREQQVRITDYSKKLEQMVEERTRQLIHADRLATLGTFSAAVAHEINNPITYIVGNVELINLSWKQIRSILEGQIDEGEIGQIKAAFAGLDKQLNRILDGADKISRLVRNFKAYSRQADKQKKKCCLLDIVTDSLNLLQHRIKKGIQVHVAVPGDLKLYCDFQKLSQVFVNLLNNAMDAMADGKGTITIKATPANNRVHILVEDDGPGIKPETADRIFEPFFTTKSESEGTGLGLFIVRSIIEEHQGEVSLSSTGNQGAGFNIVLPAMEISDTTT